MKPVQSLQEHLFEIGCDPGAIDNDFGPKAAKAYQDALLSGVLGPDSELAANARVVVAKLAPKRGDVFSRFGPPNGSWIDDPNCKGRIIMAASASWERNNIRRYTLATGHSVRLHKRASGHFIAAFADLEREIQRLEGSGLPSWRPDQVQSFVMRHKMWDPKKSLSLHSSGVAIDIDPNDNAYGKKGKIAKETPWVADLLLAWGISWGGSWKGSRDDMHFELVQR